MSTADKQAQPKAPAWAWVFVAACAAIPAVAIGGLIPSGIGAVGLTACYAIARDGRGTVGQRVLRCSLVTVAAWGAFGTLAFVVTRGGDRTVSVSSSRSGSKTTRTKIVGGKVVSVEHGRAERKDPDDMTEDERREIYLDAITRRTDSHFSFVASHNKLTILELKWIVEEGDEAGWGD